MSGATCRAQWVCLPVRPRGPAHRRPGRPRVLGHPWPSATSRRGSGPETVPRALAYWQGWPASGRTRPGPVIGLYQAVLCEHCTSPRPHHRLRGRHAAPGGPGRKTACDRVARSTHANTTETEGLSGGDSVRMRTAEGTVAAGIQARGWPAMASHRDACTTSKGGGAAGVAAAIAESTQV